jgi:hypothetical protein
MHLVGVAGGGGVSGPYVDKKNLLCLRLSLTATFGIGHTMSFNSLRQLRCLAERKNRVWPGFFSDVVKKPAFGRFSKGGGGQTPSNSTRHTCHLGSHPCKYLPGPTLLDFGDQMGTG